VAAVPGKSQPENPEVAALLERTAAIDAWRFAARAHAGQLRDANLAPYIHHPETVALLVGERGGEPAMVAAALLHDVLEDTSTESEEIAALFGADVAELVVALSDDRRISDYGERKRALREQVREAGPRAALIYAADKLANSRDLRGAYAEVGEQVATRLEISLDTRIQIWREDGEMCHELLGDSDLVPALTAELDAIERDRAAAGGSQSR
jgi:(p)ppGpp synthase/HD superfamily hydrolase